MIGVIRLDGDRRAVRLERSITAPPDAVWDALTNPARMGRWLAEVTSGSVSPGGVFELAMSDDPPETARCRVLAFQHAELLEIEWDYTGEPLSVLRISLHAHDGETMLVLDHRRIEGDASGYGAGWHAHLDVLAAEACGSPRPSWEASFDAVLGDYERIAAAV